MSRNGPPAWRADGWVCDTCSSTHRVVFHPNGEECPEQEDA